MGSDADDSAKYVTEVDGTLKSRSIVFGDPDKCNITISNNGGGSQMTITLPENFGRTASDGTTLTTQTYDMRSVIEAIMELNRRTAFMGSNCSFLTAMNKHQTTVEATHDPNNQFAANTTADGLPAARNGTLDVPSDIDGTVITAESIEKLREDIATLTESLKSANATILELSASYDTLYEATRIKSFEFTVTFNNTVGYGSNNEACITAFLTDVDVDKLRKISSNCICQYLFMDNGTLKSRHSLVTQVPGVSMRFIYNAAGNNTSHESFPNIWINLTGENPGIVVRAEKQLIIDSSNSRLYEKTVTFILEYVGNENDLV